ncbi:uncharacterized protein LOC114275683 [Camellia sinensis]|uniref:uncharacterized protein LOC114275683 n=1 Tax=Camellia sinensis TaxID=4442 RepID=UPI00103587E8|nr:uncharacterized protein LOC114275683 [Camellia sinensis]
MGSTNVSQIVDDICRKFDGLIPGAVCLVFDVPGYKKFKVDSDDDIQNMLCLAMSFGINHIEVLIQESSVGVGVIVVWWIPRRMGSKTFLSAQWAYGITHVGQCFDGGIAEFREVLCKYAVEREFQFKNPRTGSDLVSAVVADRVHDQPLTRPTDVVFDLKNEYGLDISYRVAWLDGFNHCRPLLFLDGTFLKGRFKGNLLAATAKDANQGLSLVAFAIVDSENSFNWEWFLCNLKEVVGGRRTLTFVSDRHVGLIHFIPIIFPSAHHAFCLLHLQMNLRDRMKYVNASHKIGLMRKLRECTYAPTVTCFNEKLEVLKKSNPAVIEDFLKDLHPKHWSNAYFSGRRYGEMCSNAAESFNNWVGQARHLPITRLVDMIRGQIMEQMSERRVKCTKWVGVICLKMVKKLVAAFNDSRAWCWQINGYPCSHAVVAFRNSGRNIYDSIDAVFYIDTFQATYSGTIYPIPTVERPMFNLNELLIAPPTVKRPLSRPKRKRISSKGEVVQRISCGRCGRLGNHNRKTCKEPLQTVCRMI